MGTRVTAGGLLLGTVALGALAAPITRAQPQAPANTVGFAADVQPILQRNCLLCHGTTFTFGELDLQTREGLLKGGTRGPAIVPGKAEESRLYRFIAGLEEPSMPLDGGSLPPPQVAAIKAWIDQGARWDGPDATSATAASADPFASLRNTQIATNARDYWAFKTPLQVALPRTRGSQNPIDRLLEVKRQELGLRAASHADRTTLVRRASLDLIGLPPTPEEIDAFIADRTPGAWERVIDRLLASPHYGERWGRHWLDVARYADSGGFQNDTDRPQFWRYRDYVIKSFNDDKPYDRFIQEQIAGDEIAASYRRHADRHRLPACGAASRVSREGQSRAPSRIPRRCDRHDREGRAGTDHPVRTLPRPQVRSDPHA